MSQWVVASVLNLLLFALMVWRGITSLSAKTSLFNLSEEIGQHLSRLNWRIGTAESCTGGLVAAAITEVPGSSLWFEEGVVTYANSSKQRLLGVSQAALSGYGAVSAQVVEAMANGVLLNGAEVSVATSGIAGPGGGTAEKPVGTVWMAWGLNGEVETEEVCFGGDRQAIRYAACEYILQHLLERLKAL